MNEKNQPSTTHVPWTTQDLELFHDDELDDLKRDAMSDALRRDPGLRASNNDATVARSAAIGAAPGLASDEAGLFRKTMAHGRRPAFGR